MKAMKWVWMVGALMILLPGSLWASLQPAGPRREILLDGEWQVAQGGMESAPSKFGHTVPVPGLIDMAVPGFEEVGVKSDKRDAFWYRTTFTIDSEEAPRVAILKTHKARYGTQVHLNGKSAGEQPHCFTPGYFNFQNSAIKTGGAENELLVRVGAHWDVLPKDTHFGWDFEKRKYLPGIYDSVKLILTGAPYIESVQVAPEIETGTARVYAEILNLDKAPEIDLQYKIREAKSGQIVASGSVSKSTRGFDRDRRSMEEVTFDLIPFDLHIPIENCRLWSPEDPFLYEVELTTAGDGVRARFGMRSFRFDAPTGRALLNGKPYFLRGSNICHYRFDEDPERNGLPWNREWVRDLHLLVKSMHWNSLRHTIGFPPDFWYDIADEVGILLQDEYPIWTHFGGGRWPSECTSEDLAGEYREWMRERWNHPSVVIWDAQNESAITHTGPAIDMVRGLDLSNRPWDNGWDTPRRVDDPQEVHPYMYVKYREIGTPPPPEGFLSDLMTNELLRFPISGPRDRSPALSPRRQYVMYDNPSIINEYTPFYLNRNGTPTPQAQRIIHNAYGRGLTKEETIYRVHYLQAALTEFWRCHRNSAGVLFFALLQRSGPDAVTGDAFLDVANLKLQEGIATRLRDAFNPIGLMIDFWQCNLLGPSPESFQVYVINDLYDDWRGEVRFTIERDGNVQVERKQECEVDALGRTILTFDAVIPTDPGEYKLIAELKAANGDRVRSIRDVSVKPQ